MAWRDLMAAAATLAFMAAGGPAFAAAPAGSVALGKAAFVAQCGFCHSAGPGVGEAGMGPPLAGVVGRRAATGQGFDYSQALKRSGIVWTRANLDRWLAGPGKMVPGTTMPVAVSDPKTRADLIAYLASVK